MTTRVEKPETATPASMVTVEIMGKRHTVPAGVTVIQAMWYSGHELIRGIGCLGGTCGACGIVYRVPGTFELKNGLGCQTIVQEGMSCSMLPHFAAPRASYKLDEIQNPKEELFTLYPEVARCISCGACNRVCPQGIDVKSAVWQAVFGAFAEVADLTMSCNMCGLCTARCPAEMSPNLIALYARRTHAVFHLQQPDALGRRIEEIRQGKYESHWADLQGLSEHELKIRCASPGAP